MSREVSNELLALKLAESLAAPLAHRTRRDLRVPAIPNKAIAVIGVRRGGKTSFLAHQFATAVAAGAPPGSQLFLSLEDERLVGMTAEDLGWLLEEHQRTTAALPPGVARTLYLDEIQTVVNWEVLVRRLLDAGDTRIFLSGSSARLLSREVHTSLRGRSMEVLVHPFSFREALRHAGKEPTVPWQRLSPAQRRSLDSALRDHLVVGGFPEAQGAQQRDRIALIRGYMDVMVLRDVIDRHGVTNVQALRQLERHLLASPGGQFSINKFHRDLKSQGLAVSQDTLYAQLNYLEDAFAIRMLSMHTASERQRMRNPRKIYPVDPGLIPVFERAVRENHGRSLETVMLLELERRGYQIGWVRVADDQEVDFYAQQPGEEPLLIQVSLDTSNEATWSREVRSLAAAAATFPQARALLITLDASPPAWPLPENLSWQSATQWLLAP
jgi:predicted AAA+ superfamily ATPase